ncbi:MAG: alanyl-tRNA editing protein [Eubacteriales bacterium]|nr:alanyl-tRNA editing protein [Eubacteriales bacterium]
MIETKRLYYENAYQKEFDAVVVECREAKKGFHILLDESAFYPEGGGQPYDQGTINDIKVEEVHEKAGELLHYTKTAIDPGTKIHGKIDWNRRFDFMQQHSGEHMVSGLICERFHCDNVGFHLGSDVVTIDFNTVVTEEQLLEIEEEANALIWQNAQVEITYPSPEELEKLPYRSKKELTGKVRIVRFPNADLCACCGTHVSNTGEIGMVKFLSVEKCREGIRAEMICGKRVLNYMNLINEQNRKVSVLLSAKPAHTAEAVERLYDENTRNKSKVARMEEELFAIEAERHVDQGNAILFKENLEADSVRKLTDLVMHSCKGRCIVFSDNQDGSFKYAIGEIDGDLRQFTKDMNTALNGRGGGKPFFVQGSVRASKEDILDFIKSRG